MRIFTLKQRLIVWSTTLGSVGFFLLIGLLIDRLLGTQPFALLISFAISFPVTQFLLYKRMKKHVEKEHPPTEL